MRAQLHMKSSESLLISYYVVYPREYYFVNFILIRFVYWIIPALSCLKFCSFTLFICYFIIQVDAIILCCLSLD
jgi:hypothetical protein